MHLVLITKSAPIIKPKSIFKLNLLLQISLISFPLNLKTEGKSIKSSCSLSHESDKRKLSCFSSLIIESSNFNLTSLFKFQGDGYL